jgi:hypothetical protein
MVRVPLTAEQIERGRLLGAALREARGPLTMVEVAARAHVSVETLRKIETGPRTRPVVRRTSKASSAAAAVGSVVAATASARSR